MRCGAIAIRLLAAKPFSITPSGGDVDIEYEETDR